MPFINNVEVYGLHESIEASGYPKAVYPEFDPDKYVWGKFPNRAYNLGSADRGSGHDCYLKGIVVQFDFKHSLISNRQALRYHFLDIVSSQSTMHKALSMNVAEQCNEYVDERIIAVVQEYIDEYNNLYENPSNRGSEYMKELELKVLYNLPSGYELTARFTTNYLQLKTIYEQRKHHKLPDWKVFCDFILDLPYFTELTGCRKLQTHY